MNIKKILLSSTIFLCLASCAFIPVISDKQPYYQACDMVTKKLTLVATEVGTLESCENGDLQECIIGSGILASASYIVSGSLVLMGNTLHWSEYKLSC
tara:strand:+ start:530 stop:823 length:294 start_codon:yes stop_codon:yes gene_type:complete